MTIQVKRDAEPIEIEADAYLPTEFGNLAMLNAYFHHQNNHFSGAIPTQFGKLEKLTTGFRLFNNKLCDAIPTEVMALSDYVSNGWHMSSCVFAHGGQGVHPVHGVY